MYRSQKASSAAIAGWVSVGAAVDVGLVSGVAAVVDAVEGALVTLLVAELMKRDDIIHCPVWQDRAESEIVPPKRNSFRLAGRHRQLTEPVLHTEPDEPPDGPPDTAGTRRSRPADA